MSALVHTENKPVNAGKNGMLNEKEIAKLAKDIRFRWRQRQYDDDDENWYRLAETDETPASRSKSKVIHLENGASGIA